MSSYILEKDFLGYDKGTPLTEVTLAEARAMECNRCGDCCNGLNPDVKKDEATGLPLFTWGSNFPQDLYNARFGQPLLVPIILGDGGPEFGESFELDADNKPYTCFSCSFHRQDSPDSSTCELVERFGEGNPKDLSTIRPRNCGEFPVFGGNVDATIIDGHSFVPPTGAHPRCTWYGIRVTGPWKNTPYWKERWEKQQNGEEVEEMPRLKPEILQALLERRATIDGSQPKPRPE